MELPLSTQAQKDVANTHPAQVWAFVCSSRRHDAEVVEAHIEFDTAQRRARIIGGCMRVGRVRNGKADTM